MNEQLNAPEPTPHIKMCAAELQAVLDRYDLAAVVVLHEPSQVTFFVKLDPSYSLAKMHGDKLKLNHPKPDLEHPDAISPGPAHTVNMFANLGGMLQQVLGNMKQSLMSAQVFYNLRPKHGFGQVPNLNGKRQPPQS